MDLKQLFQWQKPMKRVKISLIPIILFSTWLFGLRVLMMQVIVLLVGMTAEYLIMRTIQKEKTKITEAVHVTCMLFALSLPPDTPFWIAAVGIVFGVVFGKGVFGGFGRNIFNPALVARCFVYVSFPAHMTVTWQKPFLSFPGGFTKFTGGVDAVTSSTPMILFDKTGEITSYIKLFLGAIAGSAGETSVLLILIAAVYLLVTKTASWKIMVSTAVSYFMIQSVFYFLEVVPENPLFAILSGGFIFATVFMATDPVSAPKNDTSRIIYGILIGCFTFLIRSFSLFTEGIMFAILIANMFVPYVERQVKSLRNRKKVTV
ncbi:MAG: RnfABCDGE type electron transport complex subunit D [Clostridiales bacterium]